MIDEIKRHLDAAGMSKDDAKQRVEKIIDQESHKVMKRIGDAIVLAASIVVWLIGLGFAAILFATAYWIARS